MSFDKFRFLFRFFSWVFCLFIISPFSSFALEVSSPSSLSHGKSLESSQTVLVPVNNSNVSSVSSNVQKPVKSVSLSIKSITDTLDTLDVEAVGFDELEGKKILVLDDYYLVSSDANLKKNSSVKSIGLNSSIYGSLTSSTALNYFSGVINNLSPFDHYVCWREEQYYYACAYGKNLEYENGVFSGNVKYVRLYTGNYSENTVSYGSISSFSLRPSNYIVYSDYQGFPCLGGGVTEKMEILSLSIPFVFAVIWIMFLCVPFRFSFKSRKEY